MTHPGVGPLTALAFELVIGTSERFHCGKQIASYVGLVPSEESSGDSPPTGTHQQAGQFTAALFGWWKRHKLQCAATRSGAASSST